MCEKCKWWQLWSDDIGFCHKRSPERVKTRRLKTAVWPKTTIWDECGDFETVPRSGEKICVGEIEVVRLSGKDISYLLSKGSVRIGNLAIELSA